MSLAVASAQDQCLWLWIVSVAVASVFGYARSQEAVKVHAPCL